MCNIFRDELNLPRAERVEGPEAACDVVQYRYSKTGHGCLKFVIVDVFSDGREEYAEQEAGEVCWYPFVPSAAERTAFHRLIAADETGHPWPLINPIEAGAHAPERGCSKEWLMEVIRWARQKDVAARQALFLILETERKSIVVAHLVSGDVHWEDLSDAHHDVLLRVGEKIEQLQHPLAYFAWERRIISDISRKYRRGYARLGEPLEAISMELERKKSIWGDVS